MCVIENFMLAVKKNKKNIQLKAVPVTIYITPEIVTSFTCIRLKKGHIFTITERSRFRMRSLEFYRLYTIELPDLNYYPLCALVML